MPRTSSPDGPQRYVPGIVTQRAPRRAVFVVAVLLHLAVDPVVAQTTGAAFCSTAMAQTVKNIFRLIQFGGPLLGGVIALGATVALPTVRRSDLKRELKEMRNQALTSSHGCGRRLPLAVGSPLLPHPAAKFPS